VRLALAVLLLAAACRKEQPVRTTCTVNSDCQEPLVCAFERCHAQCNASRDCPTGQLCVRTAAAGVCQLVGEASCSGCLGDQSCVDGMCRSVSPDAAAAAEGGAPAPSDAARALFTSLLDDFDRPDGPLNTGGVTRWIDEDHRGLDTYLISGKRLASNASTAVPIWWSTPFAGAATTTEAFITIVSLGPDVTDFSLLLAAQTLSFCDFVRVLYEVPSGNIKIVSCQDGVGIVYDTVPVGLIANQQLAARFDTGSGMLAVFLGGKKLGEWKIDRWRYLDQAGRIGIWLHREGTGTSGPDLLDDFGGR
jgi:hypothetical protein